MIRPDGRHATCCTAGRPRCALTRVAADVSAVHRYVWLLMYANAYTVRLPGSVTLRHVEASEPAGDGSRADAYYGPVHRSYQGDDIRAQTNRRPVTLREQWTRSVAEPTEPTEGPRGRQRLCVGRAGPLPTGRPRGRGIGRAGVAGRAGPLLAERTEGPRGRIRARAQCCVCVVFAGTGRDHRDHPS